MLAGANVLLGLVPHLSPWAHVHNGEGDISSLPLSLIPTALSWLHDLHHIDCDPRGGIFISPIRVVLDYTEGSERVSLGFHAHFWIFISVVAVAVGNYSLVFEGNSSAMNSSAKLHLPALVAQTHLGKEGFRRSPIGLYRPLLEKFVS